MSLVAVGSQPASARAAGTVPSTPVITAPASGTAFCNESVFFEGISDAGDHIEIHRSSDDLLIATFISSGDQEGTWRGNVQLQPGPWSVYAVAVNPSNDAVSAPSAGRAFTIVTGGSLSGPTLTPNVIAPANRDGVRDSSVLSVKVERPGNIVLVKIMDGSTLVRRSPGMVASVGWKYWTWDGKTTAGSWAASKRYTVIFEWTKSGCAADTRTHQIVVDNVAPKISWVTDSPATLYPVTDGYYDTAGVRFTTDSPANVMMRIYPHGSSSIVRQIGWIAYSTPTTRTFIWNGRKADGTIVPAGVYDYQFYTSDFYGNRRSPATGRGTITVSTKRRVSKTQIIHMNGDNGNGGPLRGCGEVRPGSRYPRGQLIAVTDCDGAEDLNEWVQLVFHYRLVWSALSFESLRFDVVGYSPTGDEAFLMVLNRPLRAPDTIDILPPNETVTTTIVEEPKDYVGGSRDVVAYVMMPDWTYRGTSTYDVKYVKLTVNYTILV